VLRSLPDFPRTLSLKEQGLFALGYYHQRADDRAQARERAAARAEANRPTQQPAQS
jgi:CRISPR-associated protein Csd1